MGMPFPKSSRAYRTAHPSKIGGTYFDQAIGTVDRPISRTKNIKQDFWRKDEPIFVDSEIKIGGMWAAQRAWWDLPNFVKAFVAGFGAGKTNIGAKRIISSCLQNAPYPVAAISPTYLLARRTSIATIIELLSGKQRLLGGAFWWRYNRSISEFKIRYHGREGTIIIQSGEDPLRLRGPNLAAAWIDEPFLQEQAVFDQMIARVRHPMATLPEILLTGTSESLNWGWELCQGELSERHDIKTIFASTRANLALGADYVKRLEGSFTNKAAEAYIEGRFVNLSIGQIFYAYHNENNRDLPIPDNAELGCGLDFNVNPMAASVFWRSGSHMHFFDEIELEDADTERMCAILKERYVNADQFKNNPLRDIYPDATGNARKTAAPGGKTDFHYIREAGFNVCAPRTNPKPRDRENAVNGKLKPKIGDVTLTIGPKCKRIKNYLSVCTHELSNKQKAKMHLLFSFSYPIHFLFPITREVVSVVKLHGA